MNSFCVCVCVCLLLNHFKKLLLLFVFKTDYYWFGSMSKEFFWTIIWCSLFSHPQNFIQPIKQLIVHIQTISWSLLIQIITWKCIRVKSLSTKCFSLGSDELPKTWFTQKHIYADKDTYLLKMRIPDSSKNTQKCMYWLNSFSSSDSPY